MSIDREWPKCTPHCVEGTLGVEIIDGLDARKDEIHVTERRYSSFFQTGLDLTPKDMKVDQVIVYGVVSGAASVVRALREGAFVENTSAAA